MIRKRIYKETVPFSRFKTVIDLSPIIMLNKIINVQKYCTFYYSFILEISDIFAILHIFSS